MAKSLLRGEGFNEPFIWHRLNNYDQVVHPIDYWMPGGILLYSMAIFFMGETGGVALNIILWSILCLMAFADVYATTKSYMSAFLAYMFFLAAGRMIFFLLTTDNIAFYAAIGYMFFHSLDSDSHLPVKTGIVMGLAILTRIDGMIFSLLSIPVVFYKTRSFKLVVGFIITVLIVILPWVLRNSLVLGRYWPSNIKSLLISEYEDIFNQEFSGSVETFARQGIYTILVQRLAGVCRAFVDFVVIPSEFVFLPFWLAGLVVMRKQRALLFVYYLILILFISGIFFPFQSQKGTSMHISSFFFPFWAYLVGVGFNAFMQLKRARRWFCIAVMIACLAWIVNITYSSVQNYSLRYDTAKNKYQVLFRQYKPAVDQIVVSRNPVFVYELTMCRGVVWSKNCVLDPFKTAEKFGANYIVAGNQLVDRIASWTSVASSDELFLYRRVSSESANERDLQK